MNDFEQLIQDFEQGFFAGQFQQTEEFLQQRNGSLPDNRQSVVTELLHTELELKIRTGSTASVEGFLDRFPELCDDKEFVFELITTEYKVRRYCEPGLRDSEFVQRFPTYSERLLRFFASQQTTKQNNVGERSANYSDQDSRFRKHQLHDKGGLGNVWLARDLELNRIVAIKEIKDKFSSSESHRYRFARETLITSQLEHPGIVPVYGLGHRGDGTPYFAMQFIDGKTLQAAISDFHSTDFPATDRDRDMRRLLQRFIDVCYTVQFAHSRGIIHRDLKPANVMLGPYGETYVVDWGLASVVDDDDSWTQVPSEVSKSFTKFSQLAETGYSADGETIGSLGFMSPEQLKGNLSALGPTSDVFSLGATLWSIISGQKIPATSDDPNMPAIDLDTQAIAPEYLRLKSICKKATQRKPSQRYAAPSSLAEDVENFLADRQMVSHPDSLQDRIGRFTRNNKTAVSATLTALILVSLISFGSVIWINHERSVAVNALEEEERAKNSAEIRTAQLTKAISTFANLFSGVDERGVSYELNEVTLQDSIGKLGQIEAVTDPLVRSFLHSVYAHKRIATGEYSKAAKEFETALDWLRQDNIAETDPLYIENLVMRGFSLYNAQNIPAAKEVADRAIALIEMSDANVERDAAQAYLLKATVAHLHGNNDEAFESISKSYETGIRAYATENTNPSLLKIIQKRAEIFIKKGQIPEAKQTYQMIIDTFVNQGKLHHLVIDSRMRLAELYQFFDYDPQSATRVLEPIIKESRELWGVDHYETLVVESEYVSFQFLNGDELQKRASLTRMNELLNIHMDSGIKSRAVDATIILGNLLSRQKPQPDHQQILKLIDSVVSKDDYTEEHVAADSLWKLYSLRSNCLTSLKKFEHAIVSLRETVPVARQAYGTDSVQYKSLLEKIDYMESGITDFNSAQFNQKLINEHEKQWKELSKQADPTDPKLLTVTWQFSKTLEYSNEVAHQQRAITLLEDLVGAFENVAEVDKRRANLLVMVYVDLARMYENKGDFNKALHWIDEAMTVGIHHQESGTNNAQILIQLKEKLKTQLSKEPSAENEKARDQ